MTDSQTPDIQPARLNEAIKLATDAHGLQRDKSGQPYILHPLRVMTSVHKLGAPLFVLAAAVLHDTVEDTWLTIGGIATLISPDVAVLVDLVTRRDGEVYMEFLRRASTNPWSKMIKMADVLDNLERVYQIDDMEDREFLRKRWIKAFAFLTSRLYPHAGTMITEDEHHRISSDGP